MPNVSDPLRDQGEAGLFTPDRFESDPAGTSAGTDEGAVRDKSLERLIIERCWP